MTTPRYLIFALLYGAGCAGVAAAAPALADSEQAQRSQLAQQRSAVEADFASEVQACGKQFSVNACLERARALRSTRLPPIQAVESALDGRLRSARAAAGQERVAARQREFVSADDKRLNAALLAPVDAKNQHERSSAVPFTPTQVASAARTQALRAKLNAAEQEALHNRELLALRQRQSIEHQRNVALRKQQRAAQGHPVVASLPSLVPSAVARAADRQR